MISWKCQLLIHPQAVPDPVLLTAMHPWLVGMFIPPFYTSRWLKSLPVSSLLCQLVHRRTTNVISKPSQGKASWLKPWDFIFIYIFFLVLWTYLKLFLIFLIWKPTLRQMHQAGPVRGADLVPRGYDLRYMQICFGSTWALLSSKWLKANENWPEHGYTILERNPNGCSLRQLCLVFNFSGGILKGAECKPLRDIIFLQCCDMLAARWEHLLCQSKPGRLRLACPRAALTMMFLSHPCNYLRLAAIYSRAGTQGQRQESSPSSAQTPVENHSHGQGWGCRHSECQSAIAAPDLQQWRGEQWSAVVHSSFGGRSQ